MRRTSALAVSIGDPAGIGPEIILGAWLRRHQAGLGPFAVIGGSGVLRAAARHMAMDCPVIAISSLAGAPEAFGRGLPVLDARPALAGGEAGFCPGQPDKAGARLALDSLEAAVVLARCGEAAALVTAPVAKARIGAICPDFTGQTELVADACLVARVDAVMMLAGPSLRTVPLTVHCALAEVPGRLSMDLILRRCRKIAAAMRRDFGIARPRLAVCGLNPHAGEEGRMGDEEIRIIAPAIAALQAEGIAASGPHPADTLFAAHKRPTYDVAVAMYHDQALVPLKTLDFDEGVNITLGLPIVRTSPDHGTAFDIAGQGRASPGAMIAALRLAGEVATRRQADDGR